MKYDLNQIILADCMDIMRDIPDKYFELAIVDPPYGINAPNMQMGQNLKKGPKNPYPATCAAPLLKKARLNQGSGKLKNRILNKSIIDWDYKKPSIEYFNGLRRISKNQIIFGGNYFDLGPTRCVICWDKVQPWDNFSQWEMAWTSFDKPASLFRYSNTGGDIKSFERKIHPTQKPVTLYRWLLQNYAKPGDKIIDTHSGSGSCAIACHIEKHDFLAIEKDPDYHAASVKRLEEVRAQGVLF
jgi:site-specific DNA-methyltransferase (adenine-specific)